MWDVRSSPSSVQETTPRSSSFFSTAPLPLLRVRTLSTKPSRNRALAWIGGCSGSLRPAKPPSIVVTGDEQLGPRGYSIVRAEFPGELHTVLKGPPHLKVGAIEIYEFLAVPGT